MFLSLKSDPKLEEELNQTVEKALKKEAFSPRELEIALEKKKDKMSAVNRLLFQGLEQEFAKGRLFGLTLTVKTVRTLHSFYKTIQGNA